MQIQRTPKLDSLIVASGGSLDPWVGQTVHRRGVQREQQIAVHVEDFVGGMAMYRVAPAQYKSYLASRATPSRRTNRHRAQRTCMYCGRREASAHAATLASRCAYSGACRTHCCSTGCDIAARTRGAHVGHVSITPSTWARTSFHTDAACSKGSSWAKKWST